MLYMQKHACMKPIEEDQLLLLKSHICFSNHAVQKRSGVISKYQMLSYSMKLSEFILLNE